jgi:hypothetical protein
MTIAGFSAVCPRAGPAAWSRPHADDGDADDHVRGHDSDRAGGRHSVSERLPLMSLTQGPDRGERDHADRQAGG